MPTRRPVLQRVINRMILHHELKIGVRAFITEEPAPVRKNSIEDSNHASDFVPVAGLSGRQVSRGVLLNLA